MVKPSRKNNGPVRVSGVLTALFVLFWSSILIVQLKGWNIKNGIVVIISENKNNVISVMLE